MKERIRIKQILGYFATTLGVILAVVALGSNYLGIDRSPGWGPARTFMLGVGLVLIFVPHIRGWWLRILSAWRQDSVAVESYLGQPGSEGEVRLERAPNQKAGEDLPSLIRRSRIRGARLIIACVALLSSLMMVWLITAGTWVNWHYTTRFIPLLADGFRAGKTHLLVEPDEALLALEDPYPFKNRENISTLWDASLYDGKYYLYWGPTPALLLAPFRGILPGSLGDQHIGWFFTSGVILLLLLLLLRVWQRYFLHLPLSGFAITSFAAGFAPPVIWLASRMAVYETAIASGQFFLLAGLHMLFPWGQRSPLRLSVAGIAWSLAVGSRVTLGPVVMILALVYMGWIGSELLKARKWKQAIHQYSPFLVPLILGAFVLLWYNNARFGSVFEFGHRFQLGREDIRLLYEYGSIVSLDNLAPNIYNYLLSGLKTISVFPYVKPEWGQYGIPFLKLYAGSQYQAEKVTGLLVSTPFTLFAVIPIYVGILRWWEDLDVRNTLHRRITIPIAEKELVAWYLFLVLAVVTAWIPMLLYQTCATRYLVDVTPGLLLLSAIGYWHMLSKTQTRSLLHTGIFSLGLVLALYSAITAILLSITGYYGIMEQFNPVLFYQLTEYFTW